jgi:hypothetical protein
MHNIIYESNKTKGPIIWNGWSSTVHALSHFLRSKLSGPKLTANAAVIKFSVKEQVVSTLVHISKKHHTHRPLFVEETNIKKS